MKRIINLCLCICLVAVMIGCSLIPEDDTINKEKEKSNIGVETDETIAKDVVFLNVLPVRVANDIYVDESVLEKMAEGLSVEYTYNETADKNTLYAFKLFIYHSQNVNAEEIMKSEGISIVKNYPEEMLDDECVIACTMDDLVRVFDGEDSRMNDIMYEITPAPRPDMLDIFKEIGWTEEIANAYDWYVHKTTYVQKYIGTETQVTLSVKVE